MGLEAGQKLLAASSVAALPWDNIGLQDIESPHLAAPLQPHRLTGQYGNRSQCLDWTSLGLCSVSPQKAIQRASFMVWF